MTDQTDSKPCPDVEGLASELKSLADDLEKDHGIMAYLSREALRGLVARAAEALTAYPGTGGVVGEIAAERQRQIDEEGWTPEHDDEHDDGQMAMAAACYANFSGWSLKEVPPDWPWAKEWWKPKDKRRDLVRSGALIVAEIERLDRLPPAPKGESDDE